MERIVILLVGIVGIGPTEKISRFNLDYPLCSVQMKLPSLAPAPLESRSGDPSAALLRAAEIWPASSRGSQLSAILQTAGGSPPRFVVLATMDSEDVTNFPIAAILAEILPGRAAVVMAPQIGPLAEGGLSSERLIVARMLLQAMNDHLKSRGVLLAQALSGGGMDPTSAWFAAAGYRAAGDLLYLSADLQQVARQPVRPPLLGPLELVAHSPDDFERWIPLVEATYINTLDCPAVDGLRPTRDVLLGYRDIGAPRDDWWFIVRHEKRDVGCLILADHRTSNHAELVYMGLVPDVRGRGWGVYLAQQSQRLAAAAGAQQLLLSVDANNRPALRHYQAAGFQFWEQRQVWINGL